MQRNSVLKLNGSHNYLAVSPFPFQTPPKQGDVVLLEDAGVGKTSILECFSKLSISGVASTAVPNVRFRITLWDTPGDEPYRHTVRFGTRHAQGALLV
jgi:GTPase SAR1 family protein